MARAVTCPPARRRRAFPLRAGGPSCSPCPCPGGSRCVRWSVPLMLLLLGAATFIMLRRVWPAPLVAPTRRQRTDAPSRAYLRDVTTVVRGDEATVAGSAALREEEWGLQPASTQGGGPAARQHAQSVEDEAREDRAPAHSSDAVDAMESVPVDAPPRHVASAQPPSADDPLDVALQHMAQRHRTSAGRRDAGGAVPLAGQYVVYVPDEGFGNRLRGVMSTFALAAVLNRTFLIWWIQPVHWSAQLSSRVPYDWDFEHYLDNATLNSVHVPANPSRYAHGNGNIQRAVTAAPSREQPPTNASSGVGGAHAPPPATQAPQLPRPTMRMHCLTLAPWCDPAPFHAHLTQDLAAVYKDTDFLIIKTPDIFLDRLLANPMLGPAARALIHHAHPANLTFEQRILRRLLAPSTQVQALMAGHTQTPQYGMHARTDFCSADRFHAPLRAAEPRAIVNSTWFVAADQAAARAGLVSALQRAGAASVQVVDFKPVHSNDPAPAEDPRTFLALVADFFLLQRVTRVLYLTRSSSFSEAVAWMNPHAPRIEWLC